MLAAKCTIILAAAWLALFFLRRKSASVRHLVWTSAFTAVLLLPILSMGLPALPTPMLSFLQPAGVTFQSNVLASPASPTLATNPQAASHLPARWRLNWRSAVLFVWTIGSLLSLAQMLLAAAFMIRLRRRLPPFHLPGLEMLIRTLRITRRVDLLANSPGSMPMAFGVFSSAVLMPSDAEQWSAERRRIVLLHELAHIRRGDTITHLLARTALGLYWWNPLAWLAWFEFLKERERAADDLVLTAGTPATEYAAHLLEIARGAPPAPALAWAAVAMARPSQLECRLETILDSRINRQATGKLALAAAVLAAITITGPLAALRAQSPDLEATIRAAQGQHNPQMLEDAAQAAVTLRKYDIAQKLLDSALALRGNTPESGHTFILLGDLKRVQGQTAAALPYYAQAASALGNRPETSTALIHLGAAKLGKTKNFAGALEDFELAQMLDPPHAGAALMWLAVVHQRQGELAEAESLYRASLHLDPSPAAAQLLRLLLANQGRQDEAKQIGIPAAAVARARSATPGVYRVGDDIKPPSVLSKVEPQYTDEARAALLYGKVILYVVVQPDGQARDIYVARSLGLGLDEKAVEAINQWRFKPGTKDGQPVNVAATIEVNFRLL